MIVVWLVSLPFVMLNSEKTDASLDWRDAVGWTMFGVGFLCETIADQQKFWYRNQPEHKGHWCDIGLWKWRYICSLRILTKSRHPNYFGELLLWWGIYISCTKVFEGPQFATAIGPAILSLFILFVSGICALVSTYT